MNRPLPLRSPRRPRSVQLVLAASVVLVAALLPTIFAGPASAAVVFSSTAVNQGNGNCADVPGGASTSALQLIQWSCNSGTNQSFTFTPVSGTTNTYTIGTVASGSCVDVTGASTADNARIIQYACHTATNQQFRLQPVTISGATNTFNLVAVHSGKCIAPTGDSSASNTGLVQLPCSTATSRVWRLPSFTSGGTGGVSVTNPGNRSTVVGTSVSLTLTASGGTGSYTWSATGLPAGLSLNTATGVISGAPTTAGTSTVTVTASSGGQSGSASFTWTVTTSGGNRTFRNPLDNQGPDPWLQYYNGFYYLAATTWNSTITMRRSRTLGGLATAAETVIFDLRTRPNGRGTMWAPEFHLLNGPNGQRWYFYYVSGNEQLDLGTQRIRVLESAGLDPMGPYTFKADMLDPTQNNTWELDPSILQLNGQLYLLGTFYNGSQPNFIRPLSNPWTASGTRRILSTPTLSWETVGGAVNEGAEVIQRNGRTFIVFSASHCSTPDYKLGILTYNGGDPLNSSSWVKSSQPVFQRSNANGVYGPGHNGFFKSPDGTEDWIVYHANNSASGGCDMNRTTRAQKFTWNADGTPNFGTPASLSTDLAVPSGEPAP